MVTVTYRKWSFTRGSNCEALTGKILVFWIGGCLWEVVAYGRWSLMRGSCTWGFDCNKYIRDLTKPRRWRQQEPQKTIGLMSKTKTVHVHRAFLYIALPSLHNNFTTTWNDQTLSLLGNGNGKTINSTISVRTLVHSPLFSSSWNPLLISNRANWDNREKV